MLPGVNVLFLALVKVQLVETGKVTNVAFHVVNDVRKALPEPIIGWNALGLLGVRLSFAFPGGEQHLVAGIGPSTEEEIVDDDRQQNGVPMVGSIFILNSEKSSEAELETGNEKGKERDDVRNLGKEGGMKFGGLEKERVVEGSEKNNDEGREGKKLNEGKKFGNRNEFGWKGKSGWSSGQWKDDRCWRSRLQSPTSSSSSSVKLVPDNYNLKNTTMNMQNWDSMQNNIYDSKYTCVPKHNKSKTKNYSDSLPSWKTTSWWRGSHRF